MAKKAQKTKQQLQNELDEIRKRLQDIVESSNCSGHIKKELLFKQTIFNNASEGIVITNADGVITDVNPGFCAITGYTREEAVGKKPEMLKSDRHDSGFYNSIWSSLAELGKWQGELWNRRKNGEIYPEWLNVTSIRDKKGTTTNYIGIFTDITRYINKNIHVRNHAYYDTLTSLPNRTLLNDRLSFMVSHARRNKQLMAILLLDLNRFKFINDTLGYTVGDTVLQTISERLKSCLRDVDAIFRLGDDEFAIILEEIAQLQDAARVAKRILTVSSLPIHVANHELYVTSSIGISIFPTDGNSPEILLKNAEAAMHRSKELGINNYQHYKPAMNARSFEQLTLEHNLRKALKNNEFLVYYQPLIDLLPGTIIGAEALVRWRHPELGMILPAQFIPLAEETGLILPIGEWVLHTACTQVRQWQSEFNEDYYVSVNLSARQFQQQDLVSTINRVLKETNFNPELLVLEITESVGMKNPEQTLRVLQELKEMGIHIAIDDFGTGYSSLSYLKRFPIDTIKIDRSFVRDVPNDSNDTAIVLAIIAMARSLKLSVIAEGVETKEQANYLLSNGCHKMQGYLYSPPVCPEDFYAFLSNRVGTLAI